MAVNDFQDQEEIENFKHFWKNYGRWIFGVLLLAAAAYLGWVIYQGHLREQNEKAGDLADTFATQLQAGNDASAKKALLSLQQDYGNTLPAAQSTLIMAAAAFETAKYDEAIGHLQWVAGKQKNDLFRTITAQRLAVVYLQQQKYNEALSALNVTVDKDFQPILLETKGDVFQAQQKNKEAIDAYTEASKLLIENSPQRALLQLKIDALS
ncbi:YfgM family protein [Stenoxybacter acetivorans]|uniref:YfgM family protein n=1 Tax=Stenoxybacter acetivorans TaxID=422441 RepID=UPI00056A5B35|nr:tetratricopeptide repeat protein [Stenoxybacter acetivorans]